MSAESTKQRRAFSVLQHRGRIECGGAAFFARGLTRALRAPMDEPNLAQALTHGVHSYPARMHPAMARALVHLLAPRSVLDPFCGSGTTLVEGRFAGHKSVGVDINPLAVLVARAKTWIAPKHRRDELLAKGRAIGEQALHAGSEARRAGGGSKMRRGSKRRDHVLAGWFAPHVRRELEWLAEAIEQVGDAEFVPIYQAVLSATLYKVSQRTSDTDPSKIERHIARGAPARLFIARLEELVSGLQALGHDRHGGHPHVICGDSRRLHRLGIGEGAFDSVISSPPYPGTYDYADYQRLRLTFLGIDADFRSKEIGARHRFEGRKADGDKALLEWRKSFARALTESARAVKRGGHVALVMGDSLAGKRPVFADDVLKEICPPTLTLAAWARAHRPMLGGDERRAFGERGKHEHIFLFTKT
jgi:SAM-dependent methyltransferase